MLPIYNQCCCCFPLRTGALIIGYLDLINSVIGGINFAIAILHPDHKGPSDKYTGATNITAACILLAFIIISALLVIGIHKNIPGYVAFYYKLGLVKLVILVPFIVGCIVYLAVEGDKQMGAGYFAILSVCLFLLLALQLYWILVIRSYHRVMIENLQYIRLV